MNNYVVKLWCAKARACRSAFTLVEVLVALMLVSLGLMAALSLTLFGIREGKAAMAMATAYSTARTVLYDKDLLPADGYLNGYFVQRTLDKSFTSGGMTLDLVRVRVFWGEHGTQLAGLTSYLRR